MLWSVHLDGGPRRVNHAAVALNGAIYSFGGYCSNEQSDGAEAIDIHVLNCSNYRWRRITHANVHQPMSEDEEEGDDDKAISSQVPYMRYGHTVVEYAGKAYLWGGRNDEYGASAQLHEFDPTTLLWRLVPTEGRCPPARDGHSAVVYGTRMYVFGGFEEEAQRFSQETYVFDFLTNKWSFFNAKGPLPLWRDFHTAVQIDGTMLVFGGRSDITGEFHSTRDMYDDRLMMLDLRTAEWSEVNVGDSKKPSGRRSHSAWVHNGRMYIFGGYQGAINRHYNDIHCFDPSTSRWSHVVTKGLIPSPRRRQCTVVLGDRLFLFGGTRPSDSPYDYNAMLRSHGEPSAHIRVEVNEQDGLPNPVRLPMINAPPSQNSPRLNDLADLYVLEFVPTLKDLALFNIVSSPERLSCLLTHYANSVPIDIINEIIAMTSPNKISTNQEPEDRRVAAG